MILGIIFAAIAGLLWGLIFIGPLLIPEYPSVLQASGRYIAFGLISLPISWYDRKRLRKLLLEDWLEATKLVLTGHLIYYTCLAGAIQNIGAPITTAIVGTLPLIITIHSYFISSKKEKIAKELLIHIIVSLLFILMGLFCINISELKSTFIIFSIKQYFFGIILSITAVLCWSWYALKNAYWLKTHPNNHPITWANAQGVVTLPLSCFVYCCACISFNVIKNEFVLPFGPRPLFFIILMILIGFFCSWLGTVLWNEASQRLPITLIGPLITFETIAGLMYAFIHRQLWPSLLVLFGVFLLIFGIIYATYLHKYIKNII